MANKCPNPMCTFTFDRRNLPEICSALLGTATGAKAKQKKQNYVVTANPKHVTVELGPGLYSVQYHQYNRSGISRLTEYFTCVLTGVWSSLNRVMEFIFATTRNVQRPAGSTSGTQDS